MYLSDAEVAALSGRLLAALSPGGRLFFRESCFRQSGDRARAFNPSHYRTMAAYTAAFEAAHLPGGGAVFHLVRLHTHSTLSPAAHPVAPVRCVAPVARPAAQSAPRGCPAVR